MAGQALQGGGEMGRLNVCIYSPATTASSFHAQLYLEMKRADTAVPIGEGGEIL